MEIKAATGVNDDRLTQLSLKWAHPIYWRDRYIFDSCTFFGRKYVTHFFEFWHKMLCGNCSENP